MKKILIIASILLLFMLIFWGLYTFLIKDRQTSDPIVATDTVEDSEGPRNQPTALTQKVSNIMSFPIMDVVALEGTDLLRVWTKTGRAFEMTERGTNQKEIGKLSLENVVGAVWGPEGQELILRTADGLNTRYTPTSQELIKLKGDLDFVEWSDLPGRILYKFFDEGTGERTLNIADSNGLNWQKLVDLPYRRAAFVQIPGSLRVAYWPDGDAFVRTQLEAVSAINPSSPDVLMTDRFGADFLFSPDGRKFLVSSTLDEGGMQMAMGIAEVSGGLYQNLQIPTIVSKATWSRDNKTVYYAQPTEIPPGSVMPNDYKRGKFTTRDTLWRVDTTTGKKERIISLEDLTEKIDITNLFLSQDEDALFFINKVNGLLYRMNI